MKRGNLAKAIWLHLAREGGRWSMREITEFIKSDEHHIDITLTRMAKQGTVARFEKAKLGVRGSRIRYGIKADCVVPRGITIRELEELRLVKGSA